MKLNFQHEPPLTGLLSVRASLAPYFYPSSMAGGLETGSCGQFELEILGSNGKLNVLVQAKNIRKVNI